MRQINLLLGVSISVFLFLACGANESAAQPPSGDPALCFPEFAALAQQYPSDWEERVHPRLRPFIEFQRILGEHAMIVAFSDEEPNPTYTDPKVIISVAYWDGMDLFSLGLPRTYNGKPVVIRDRKEHPTALPGEVAAPQPTPTTVPGCPGPK